MRSCAAIAEGICAIRRSAFRTLAAWSVAELFTSGSKFPSTLTEVRNASIGWTPGGMVLNNAVKGSGRAR